MQRARTVSEKSPNGGCDEIVLPNRKAVNAAISDGMRRERERVRSTRQPGARQWITLADDAKKRKPGDIFWQFNYCIRNGKLPAGTGIARNVGSATQTKFGTDCRLAFNELREEGEAVHNLRDLNVKRVLMLVKRWVKEGKSPSTITGRITALRKLNVLLGRPAEIPTGAKWKRMLQANDIDPTAIERSQIRVVSKSVSSKGLNPQDVIDGVPSKDYLESLWLRLQWKFGMRPRECAELNPMESDLGEKLLLMHGTKGHRERTVQFSTNPERAAQQRSLLDEAKRQARMHPQWKLRDRGRTVEKALNHFYYVMRKSRITKAELEVMPYAFRHEFAHEEFEEQSGLPAPVLRQVDPSEYLANAEAVAAAQRHVVQQMGHSAVHKYNSYGGSFHEEIRRLKRQKAALTIVGGSTDLAAAMEAAQIQEAWLVGKAATGDKLKDAEPIELALRMPQALSPAAMLDLGSALQALGRPVKLSWCTERPQPGLEVIFPHQRVSAPPGLQAVGTAGPRFS